MVAKQHTTASTLRKLPTLPKRARTSAAKSNTVQTVQTVQAPGALKELSTLVKKAEVKARGCSVKTQLQQAHEMVRETQRKLALVRAEYTVVSQEVMTTIKVCDENEALRLGLLKKVASLMTTDKILKKHRTSIEKYAPRAECEIKEARMKAQTRLAKAQEALRQARELDREAIKTLERLQSEAEELNI